MKGKEKRRYRIESGHKGMIGDRISDAVLALGEGDAVGGVLPVEGLVGGGPGAGVLGSLHRAVGGIEQTHGCPGCTGQRAVVSGLGLGTGHGGLSHALIGHLSPVVL